MNRPSMILAGLMLLAVVANAENPPWELPAKKVKTKTQNVQADQKEESGASPRSSDSMKFNTEGDVQTSDKRGPMKFKTEDKPLPAFTDESADEKIEQSVYKAYPGYPKHKLGFSFMPIQVSSKWSYLAQDYNYKSNSNAFELNYSYQPSPFSEFTLYYNRYESSIKAGTIPAYGVIINKSDVAVDNYGLRTQFCKNSEMNFFRQFCLGVDAGVESYPLLDFVDGTTLELSKVQDIVLGVNLGYNHPLTGELMLKSKVGYNMGTGAGNSGELSTKSNNSLYGNINGEWNVREKHAVTLGFEYKKRSAEVKGQRGSNDDKWKSDIVTTAFKLGYLFSF